MDAFDFDSSGAIEYQEYITGLCDKNLLFQDINLKRFFELNDKGKKGYLNSEDIISFAFQNKNVNKEVVKEYLKQFGMKIDDKLYFDNFAYIMQNNCSLDSNQNAIENNDKKENNEYFKNSDIYEDEVEDNTSNNKEEKKE